MCVVKLQIITVTYGPDMELFRDLDDSIKRFTDDSVKHTVVVDDRDWKMFRQFASNRCEVLRVSDLLPRTFLTLPRLNVMVNLRRPWPPVRGWIFQQLVKIAASQVSSADMVLLMDSDVALVRPVSWDTFVQSGRSVYFRKDAAVHASMPRHLAWHQVAREMIGSTSTGHPPLPDYVDSFNVWSPDVVRNMCCQIEQVSGKPWQTTFSSHLHVSEFILYGVFVDEVLGPSSGLVPVDHMRCHNYWDEVPMSPDAAKDFVNSILPDDVAVMISAKSRTDLRIRRSALSRAQGR